jgi:hypothetical protein
MPTYESKFFGLRMQIPVGWSVELMPDTGFKAFVREAERWDPTGWNTICFRSTKYLLSASLKNPEGWLSDTLITLQACITTDENMTTEHDGKRRRRWNLNGIPMQYSVDRKDGHKSPEANHYRFVSWKVGTNLWLYAHIQATGKARFDYALSVFETLAPLGMKPPTKKKPLYDCEPWTIPPTLYAMRHSIDESRPLYDLDFTRKPSSEKLHVNNTILGRRSISGEPGVWTPLRFRRKSRVLVSDCYYGEKQNLVYNMGIFSARAAELLRPYMKSDFELLPCSVNGKPHFIPVANEPTECLDRATSLIKYFDHGGIMSIERYRFKTKAIAAPRVFSIPEDRYRIFTTATIPPLAAAAGLKRIAFHPVDGHGREFTFPG